VAAKDNMVNGLFLCATRRHNTFVEAEAETSDNGAEAVSGTPRCSWHGHFRRGADVGDENR